MSPEITEIPTVRLSLARKDTESVTGYLFPPTNPPFARAARLRRPGPAFEPPPLIRPVSCAGLRNRLLGLMRNIPISLARRDNLLACPVSGRLTKLAGYLFPPTDFSPSHQRGPTAKSRVRLNGRLQCVPSCVRGPATGCLAVGWCRCRAPREGLHQTTLV